MADLEESSSGTASTWAPYLPLVPIALSAAGTALIGGQESTLKSFTRQHTEGEGELNYSPEAGDPSEFTHWMSLLDARMSTRGLPPRFKTFRIVSETTFIHPNTMPGSWAEAPLEESVAVQIMRRDAVGLAEYVMTGCGSIFKQAPGIQSGIPTDLNGVEELTQVEDTEAQLKGIISSRGRYTWLKYETRTVTARVLG
ncbi:hypothetical protein M231_07714 [Tremella mesenterica]|uniref:Uncharacterized protein n=1 Tax=Tremella mesenterica TaxID=5217 RepID=A0A4Q1BBD2_TREME|nr:hypothetical protein M231_07714 [Tremella mesenterica]